MRIKIWNFRCIGMTLVLAILVLPFTVPVSVASETKTFKWKFFNNGPAVMPFSPFNVEFTEKVRERTNGRLDIRIYMTGELPYKAPDVLPVVQSRKVEIGSAWDTHCEGVQDWYSVLSMPTIFSDREEALKMNVEVVMPFMDKVLRKKFGVVPVARCIWGTSDMSSNKKLTTIADVKGQKIRCSGFIQQTLIKSLGGVPVYIDHPETYTAMQRGTVNGGLVANMFAHAGKWFEVCKWLYVWELMHMAEAIYINETAFNELPQDIQKIIMDTAEEINNKKLAKAVELNNKAIEAARNQKVTVTFTSPSDRAELQKIGDQILEDWLNKPERSDYAKELKKLIQNSKK